nr:uncharacterized protein LOC106619247 [Bactrocera oleae]
MTTCDVKYTFILASIGSYGGESDGGIFQHSKFGRELLTSQLPLPPSTPSCNESNETLPYFFVDDAAFELKTHLMRSYPGHQLPQRKEVFNYRLSYAPRNRE